ncbi:MAG TPA: hypothetical protein PK468_25080, partial [Candidatus Hydrogenedentes bacterium]|nr:hypothetical protein [Candidatus Hydrogenedentota bacterium]
PKLQIGQLAKVTVDALPGEEFDAYVRRVNPAVDPLTGTIKVVLDFDEATRIRLRESAFARVRLIMETHQQALVVPKDVLVEENGRKYVFVVEEEQPQAEEEAAELPETTGNEAAAPSVTETEASDKAGENAGEPETESPDAPPEDADAESTNTEDSKPEEPMLVAQRVEVETGFEDSSRVEIVSGIGDDSLIVTLGQHTLKPGSYVRVASAEVLLNEKKDMSVEEALAEAEAKKAKADQDSAESRRHTRH